MPAQYSVPLERPQIAPWRPAMTWAERVDALIDRACLNKVTFRNAAVAWAARDRIMTSERATNRDQIERTRPYRCAVLWPGPPRPSEGGVMTGAARKPREQRPRKARIVSGPRIPSSALTASIEANSSTTTPKAAIGCVIGLADGSFAGWTLKQSLANSYPRSRPSARSTRPTGPSGRARPKLGRSGRERAASGPTLFHRPPEPAP